MLLNLLGAIESPTAGRLSVRGGTWARWLKNQRTAFRRDGVGFVFEFFNLIPSLTARENVELVLGLTGGAAGARRRPSLPRWAGGAAGRFPGAALGRRAAAGGNGAGAGQGAATAAV